MKLIQNLPYLSKRENRIRDFFKFYIILFTIITLFRLFTYLEQIPLNKPFYLVLSIIITLALNYLLYYCAYKKHGNVWLTIQMVLNCYGTILSGWTLYNSQTGQWTDFAYSILTTGLICFLGLNLRKINNKILLHDLLSSEYNRNAIDGMRLAETLEELTNKYSEAFKACPRQYARRITVIYKEQKSRILRAGAQ